MPHTWTHTKYDDAGDMRVDVAGLRRPTPGGGSTGAGGEVRLMVREEKLSPYDDEEEM